MRIIFIGIFFLAVLDANSQSDTIHWQNLSSFPSTPRIDYASFVIDSDYYIIGGEDSGGNWYSDVWKYSIPYNSWYQMRNFPDGPITTAAGFAINGYGYICAGLDSIANYSFDNEFWQYYPEVDTWQHKANYPGVPREGPVSFIYGDYAYVGLGHGVGAFDMWRYSYASDRWDSVSTIPEGSRGACGVAKVDSFAYIFGGFDMDTYKDIWRYNLNSDHWDSIGIMPGDLRSNSIFWSFDTTIIGGYGILQDTFGNYYMGNTLYRYHIVSNSWDTLDCTNFIDSTADGSGDAGRFALGKIGYFFGGYKTNASLSFNNNMWSFDASQFFPPDTTIGIVEVKNQDAFSVYPNPVNHDQSFSILTSESGEIIFYDALDRKLDDRKLARGLNQIKLSTDDEVVFYKATLLDGATANGKIVFLK